ncbi:hypothetical protein M413DRAFT_438790 [Hebeloma cylindrosporum]|uniref:Uncharacterized protein n=1 Tax=Hebeloma cylindrosporum TaxID=76867 RepID=A0A0C2YIQ0_HEBCY|nr:hypothetical protein M413DRAFT_438790 [Hebeloma cylindrosporum h7]
MPFSSLKQLFSSLFFPSPPKTLTIFDIMSGRDKENSSPIVKGIEHTVVTYLKSQLWRSLSSTSSASQDARDNRSLYKVLDVSLYKVQASLNSYHEYIQAKVRIPPCDSHYKQPVPGEPVPPTEQFIYVRMERRKERQVHLINVVDGLQSSDPDIVRVSCEMIFNARNSGPLAALRKDRFADAKNTPVYRKFLQDLENETPGAPTRAFNSLRPANHGPRHSRSSSSRSSGSPGSNLSGSPEIADRSGLELFTSIFAPLSSSSSHTDGRDVVNFVGERPPTSDTLIHSLNVEPYDFTLLDLGLLAFEIHRADPLYSLFKHQCYWWVAMFIGVIQADIAANHRDRPQPQPLKFDPREELSYNLENVPEASKAIKQQLAALPPTTDDNIEPEPEPEPEPATNPHLQSTYRKVKVIGPHHTMIGIIYERFKFSRGNLKQTLDGFSAEYKAEEDGRKAERQRKEENGQLQLEEERRQREEERRQKEEERRQKEELQERNRKLEEELRRLNSLMGSDKQNR